MLKGLVITLPLTWQNCVWYLMLSFPQNSRYQILINTRGPLAQQSPEDVLSKNGGILQGREIVNAFLLRKFGLSGGHLVYQFGGFSYLHMEGLDYCLH